MMITAIKVDASTERSYRHLHYFNYMNNVEKSDSCCNPSDFRLISYSNKNRMYYIREGDVMEQIMAKS